MFQSSVCSCNAYCSARSLCEMALLAKKPWPSCWKTRTQCRVGVIKPFYPPISTRTFYLVLEESFFFLHSNIFPDKLCLVGLLIRWEIHGFSLIDSGQRASVFSYYSFIDWKVSVGRVYLSPCVHIKMGIPLF